MKIKVTLVAYRTVTLEVDADSEDDIDAFKLKEDAITKARGWVLVPFGILKTGKSNQLKVFERLYDLRVRSVR